MRWLASVQTPADASPTPLWQYGIAALLLAIVIALVFIVPAYLDSDSHRRRMGRVRALTHQPRRTRP